jgi:hypothetical protein
MSSEPKPAASDAKTLIPILVIIGVLLCGCIAVPAIGGLALLGFISMRAHDVPNLPEEAAVDGPLGMPGELNIPTIPEGVPADAGSGFGGSGFGGLGGGGNKQAAQAELQAAEAELQLAQASYEAAQGVYEQQRDFANQQAGRLGAQGIKLPPPMPPDPSLYQAVLAAQQRYDAAKAAYDAIP